jgi:hypothetical protein
VVMTMNTAGGTNYASHPPRRAAACKAFSCHGHPKLASDPGSGAGLASGLR